MDWISSLCRVCVAKTSQMISLDSSFKEALSEENETNEQIYPDTSVQEILHKVLNFMEPVPENYPQYICSMCLGILKVAYDFKTLFEESHQVLVELTGGKETNKSNLPVCVEIIAGSTRYNLNDLVIVEEQKCDQLNFNGFLRNLGTVISASFGPKYERPTVGPPVLEILERPKEVSEPDVLSPENEQDKECDVDSYIILCSSDTGARDTIKASADLEDDDDLIQSAAKLQYECSICKRMYGSKTRYQKHVDVCGKGYRLGKDDKGKTSLVSLLQCRFCPRIFKERKFLNYHVKTHLMPFFKCDICNQKFKSRNSRNYHRSTRHSQSSYVCQICGKECKTAATLSGHEQTHNKNSTMCICPVCGKSFHYKGGLYYHMKQHTKERKYKCHFCDRDFYTLTAKKRHILTHTGHRPFNCQSCGKAFFSKGELKKHEYTHTGHHPYKCEYCHKAFTSAFNMKIHWFNHAGSFDCEHCQRTFISSKVLEFHYKVKHKKLVEKPDDGN
ncbi:uncharacterized protein [Diabrotica undecimpunctata]|uniref:uncharacterized protein n=1 Tax=Diabrotica undecimpunctata TaxID=50387 RepID=UPI003B632474